MNTMAGRIGEDFLITVRTASAIFESDASLLGTAASEKALRDGIAILQDRLNRVRPRRESIAIIDDVVAQAFGATVDDLHTIRRERRFTFPRQTALYLARMLTDYSTTDLARRYGLRDHTTVCYAEREIAKRIMSQPGSFPIHPRILMDRTASALIDAVDQRRLRRTQLKAVS